jgi:hypothetical protein
MVDFPAIPGERGYRKVRALSRNPNRTSSAVPPAADA